MHQNTTTSHEGTRWRRLLGRQIGKTCYREVMSGMGYADIRRLDKCATLNALEAELIALQEQADTNGPAEKLADLRTDVKRILRQGDMRMVNGKMTCAYGFQHLPAWTREDLEEALKASKGE